MFAFSTFPFFREPFWVPVCAFDMLDDVERDRAKRLVAVGGDMGTPERVTARRTYDAFESLWLAIDNRQSGIG